MTKYTTRVELYGNPNYDTYEKLHSIMQSKGFTRQVQINNVNYWLPNAEYTYYGTLNLESVKNLAVTNAKSVWTDFGVMVTQTEIDRAFHNLKKV